MSTFLAYSGCALHQPWRLVNGEAGHVLVPPDVKEATLARRTLKVEVAPGDTPCPTDTGAISIKVRGKHARVSVAAKRLNEKLTGELAAWASELEATHCLAPGEAVKLSGRIAESVPLDPATAFRLLYRDDHQMGEVDIDSQTVLKVVSPYWREQGVGMIDGPFISITGTDTHLTVTAKSTENLLGYETTLYRVHPKGAQAGYTIEPLYADRTIDGATERKPQPAINYFQFPAEAAFYRLFYESWRTDFNALVIAARTPAELDQRTKKLEASGTLASCEILNRDLCIAIPKDVAVNPFIAVTVNGTELLAPRGFTVRNAILVSSRPPSIPDLKQLKFERPWNGRLMPVTFDHSDGAILSMPLGGGEVISWR